MNKEHLERLTTGVVGWNEWRCENEKIIPDLQGAKLQGSNLSGADLREADLQYANLQRTDLRRADLCGADLTGAVLHGAFLWEAKLKDIAFISVNSHDLIGHILYGAAWGQGYEEHAVAGFVSLRRDLCWKEFLSLIPLEELSFCMDALTPWRSQLEKQFMLAEERLTY